MKKRFLMSALLLIWLNGQAVASEGEARAYCENAVKVMQLEGDKAAAYIAECVKARLAEEADE
ncbi:MAG: hypothetical protein OEZ16_03815 [Chromatiales bacterium]|nr:hypothetical protein [Chromatiales bacterium]